MSDAPTPTGYQRSPGGGFRWLPPSAEHLSKLLPQYEVESLLGRGGMGAVYKGRQKSLNRPVAIKILPPEVEDEDASYLERFKNEAQVMAKFIHPGIVAVHDFGETAEGQLYIVMEFVDGTDVAQMITAQGRLPPEHALAIAVHVCDALSYAHSHGVIHRDIKPANILINREGAVKVADFGLAKVDEPGTTGLTKTGMAMGTPDYVAPEALVFGTQVDARADLYAIGVMLYHMLTGEIPRGSFDLPSRRIGTDPRFDAIILKAMRMDREERYQSSGAIRHDLDAILTMPLVQAGGESSAAIPQSTTDTPVRRETAPAGRLRSRDANARAPLEPSPSRHRNPKSKATMITLASTAAVLATGAFLVLKQPKTEPVRNADSEPAVVQGELSPNQAAPDVAAPAPKPILVAQANTTPKALQLGQSASAAPDPVRKPDPAKWVKITSVSQFVHHGGLEEVSGGWHLTKGYANLKSEAKDYAIRALVSTPGKMGITMSLRMISSGLAYRADLNKSQVVIYKSRPVATPFDGRSKLEKLASFDADTKGVYGQGDTFTFSVVGNVLTIWLGNKELGSVTDNEFAEGQLAIGATDATFRDIEYQVLDGTAPPVVAEPVPARKPDPAKWVKLDPKVDCWTSDKTVLEDGGWHVGGPGSTARLATKQKFQDSAIRARVYFTAKSASLEMRITKLADGAKVAGNYRVGFTSKGIEIGRTIEENGGKNDVSLASYPRPPGIDPSKGVLTTISACGPVLTIWIENQELGSVRDDTFSSGAMSMWAYDAIFRDIEYQVHDGTAPPAVVAQAPAAPAMPTASPAVQTTSLPPELTTLQQQYDKLLLERVTGIYDADVAKLNAGYLAGLDRAAATAQSAGELGTVLAIQKEKELIAARQPVPTNDDAKTPEALKSLRAIFRTSLTKLDEQRTANHAALRTPYATRLKQIEADLTKAGRIPDAVAVLQYRERLGTNAPAAPPAVAAAMTSETKPAPATTPTTPDDPKQPKTDDRQAAEWVLDVGGSIVIKEGSKDSYTLNSKAGLPKGRFQLLEIKLDGKTTTGPVTGESLKVLAGLRDLQSFIMMRIELADEDLSVVGTFPSLTKLEITSNKLFTGSMVKYLTQLRSLVRFAAYNTACNDDAVALLAECTGLNHVAINNTVITDTSIPHLNKLPKLQTLIVSGTQVTSLGLAQLKTKLFAIGFNLAAGEPSTPVAAIIAPKQPLIYKVYLDGTVADDAIAALKDFSKLTLIAANCITTTENMLDGLPAVPGLVEFSSGIDLPVTDSGLMKFVPLKKLKKLTIKSPKLTDAGIAAFKKARPDVTLER